MCDMIKSVFPYYTQEKHALNAKLSIKFNFIQIR